MDWGLGPLLQQRLVRSATAWHYVYALYRGILVQGQSLHSVLGARADVARAKCDRLPNVSSLDGVAEEAAIAYRWCFRRGERSRNLRALKDAGTFDYGTERGYSVLHSQFPGKAGC